MEFREVAAITRPGSIPNEAGAQCISVAAPAGMYCPTVRYSAMRVYMGAARQVHEFRLLAKSRALRRIAIYQ